MKTWKPRYFWFKGMLVIGLLLSLLLLIQSAYTYYQVSRQLVSDQLTRESERQVLAVERGLRQSGASDSEQQKAVLEDIILDNPNKIAWMRIVDNTGKVLVQAGEATGPPLPMGDLRPGADVSEPTSEVRDSAQGRVMVSIRPLRMGRGFPGGFTGRGLSRPPGAFQNPERSRSGIGLPNAPQTPESRRGGSPSAPAPRVPEAARSTAGSEPSMQAPEGGRAATRPPDLPQGPRNLLEIALYLESASAVFSPLRRNLIVSTLAALGLAAAMIIIWIRFPLYVRGKQLEEQLELARKVQTDMLPLSNPSLEGLDFAAACVAAWQVGGDFYDVFTTNKGHIALVLGDVAGKGLPAALLMGLLHGALRSMRWMETPLDQEISWRQLNYLLSTRTAPERFASLFWSAYDRESQIIRYVNAGHLPPMLLRRNGNGGCKIHRLTEGGPILGVVPSAHYKQGEIAVQPGDLLVLYSDGIVEAANATEEEFGEERLSKIIQQNCARPSAEIRDEILGQVRLFIKKEQAQDDMTLVVARLN